MILSTQTIRKFGIVTPFVESSKHESTNMSYGLSAAGYDVRLDQNVILNPGDFLLASTLEKFHMPNQVLGIVHDKSSLARRGVAVQNTVIEPGWDGYLTLELTNHGPKVMFLEQGSPIAQIIFHLLDHATEQPYGGKYQSQGRGPQEAI